MNKQEILEGNKLIAEFMGEKYHETGSMSQSSRTVKYVPHISELKFYSSWDWLMPVVREIWELDCEHEKQDEHFIEMQNCLPLVELNSAYTSCVKFIKWYNKNK